MFARLSILLVAMLAVTAAAAKGVTTKIVISGGELAEPIVITDPSILDRFSVWSGPGARHRAQGGGWKTDLSRTFIDFPAGTLDETPTDVIAFDVAFYQADRHGSETWDAVYRVRYAIRHGSAAGYFYLPTTNTHIIMHGIEDNWLRSTTEWEETVRPLVDETLAERP